jgi:hypothetical protein
MRLASDTLDDLVFAALLAFLNRRTVQRAHACRLGNSHPWRNEFESVVRGSDRTLQPKLQRKIKSPLRL